MTEPTPDTPESELTGDGLRAAILTAIEDNAEVGHDGWINYDEMADDILAALPTREAAPREGLDEALRAALLDAAHGCEPECIGGMHVPLEDAYDAVAAALRPDDPRAAKPASEQAAP